MRRGVEGGGKDSSAGISRNLSPFVKSMKDGCTLDGPKGRGCFECNAEKERLFNSSFSIRGLPEMSGSAFCLM